MHSIELFKNFNNFNIDERFEIFSNIIHKNYYKCFPIKKKTLSYKRITHPWITENLKQCLDEKYRLRRISYANPEVKSRFKAYSDILQATIQRAKRDYFLNKFESMKNDSKKTWNFINQL